ncbi:hypothetical protein AG1IA_05085 [Rhizoctonia solani AG-1 IA]|uniref:Uncharacterized protein n=1 Tax=Thanatephorus cucumeris (strain AG1-IA) TaxID=983506 RepID=L8WX10_THACA|nr:hypothetical protein AG1IA_05085 [Rhizoctonia solani AG-1 IA]
MSSTSLHNSDRFSISLILTQSHDQNFNPVLSPLAPIPSINMFTAVETGRTGAGSYTCAVGCGTGVGRTGLPMCFSYILSNTFNGFVHSRGEKTTYETPRPAASFCSNPALAALSRAKTCSYSAISSSKYSVATRVRSSARCV